MSIWQVKESLFRQNVHFKGEETEPQRDEMTYLRPFTLSVIGQGLEPMSPGSEASVLLSEPGYGPHTF